MDTKALRLFQLADSALPIGGFAFSSGLEAMAKLGLIQTHDDFLQYLETVTAETGNFDLPFMYSFYERPDNKVIWQEYNSMLLIPHIRKASVLQGRGLMRIFQANHPSEGLNELKQTARSSGVGLHYLPVLTIGLKAQGFETSDIAHLYLFAIVRDQISAAVRLGLIGPMEGQRIQTSSFKLCTTASAKSQNKRFGDACRTATALEIAQACHPRLYSKLFQN